MLQQPRHTLLGFGPTNDTASPQPTEKSYFACFAGQNGIVDVEECSNGGGEPR